MIKQLNTLDLLSAATHCLVMVASNSVSNTHVVVCFVAITIHHTAPKAETELNISSLLNKPKISSDFQSYTLTSSCTLTDLDAVVVDAVGAFPREPVLDSIDPSSSRAVVDVIAPFLSNAAILAIAHFLQPRRRQTMLLVSSATSW
jgi:hypothetical protein